MIMIVPLNLVKADTKKDITSDVEIRYKWYKEVKVGKYYPIKEKLDGYLTDDTKIQYGNSSDWSEDNCNLSSNHYFLQYKYRNTYRKVDNVRFVKLDNFTYNNNIKIYQNNKPLEFTIKMEDSSVIIDMKKDYMAETLTFYIKDASNYTITLYRNVHLVDVVLSKEIVSDDEVLIPDETWITKDTYYLTYYTYEDLKESGLTKRTKRSPVCSYQEIYIYRYKIEREYYDDDYHLDVPGYIKDVNDYQIYYDEKVITNVVEITNEKIIKEPKIEYIYIPRENQKSDSSKITECIPKIKTEIKTEVKTVEKEKEVIPKKVYILITILIFIVILLVVKLIKKNVERNI